MQNLALPPTDLPVLAYADAPGGIAAAAFMTEGWTVPPDLVTAQEHAAGAGGQRTHAASTHRIEVRTVTAVDINGHGYILTRFRGREPKKIQLIDPATMHAPPSEGPGRVVRSLVSLADAARATGWPIP